MNGFQDFLRDPKKWWTEQQATQLDSTRAEFRQSIEKANPNQGHYALAILEEMGLLNATITQNIDNLQSQAGQKHLIEIHGNRTKMRCISCEARWYRDHFNGANYPLFCPNCEGFVKSDTVMFGELIPKSVLDLCFQHIELSDCIIVIGTSGTAYPASSFPSIIQKKWGVY